MFQALAKRAYVLSCFSRMGIVVLSPYYPILQSGSHCGLWKAFVRLYPTVNLLDTWGPDITLWFLLSPIELNIRDLGSPRHTLLYLDSSIPSRQERQMQAGGFGWYKF